MGKTIIKPQFKHDCDLCVFLGRFEDDRPEALYWDYDLYWCNQGDRNPTVIARHSDQGQDYYSGIVHAPFIPALAEAAARASKRGLATSDRTNV